MSLMPVVKNQYQDDEGRSTPNGFLYTYEPGSNTLKDTFTDSGLTTTNPNPLQADGAGRLSNVYLGSGGYRMEWRDENDVVVWSQDDVFAAADGSDIANLETDIAETKQENVQNEASYTDSGVADAYVLTIKGGLTAPTAYRQGMRIIFRPTATNTGASTVNVESIGVVTLTMEDGVTDPAAGFIEPSRDYEYEYVGSIFRLLGRSNQRAEEDIEDQAISSSKIADNAVTLAKMAPGTQSHAVTYDSSNDPKETGDVVYSWKVIDTIDLTNGGNNDTSLWNVTGIASTCNALEVLFYNEGHDSSATVKVRVGPSGGTVNTGYDYISTDDSGANVNATDGFDVTSGALASAKNLHGKMEIRKIAGTNNWVASGHAAASPSTFEVFDGDGIISLAGDLTQLDILVDAGNFNQGTAEVRALVQLDDL